MGVGFSVTCQSGIINVFLVGFSVTLESGIIVSAAPWCIHVAVMFFLQPFNILEAETPGLSPGRFGKARMGSPNVGAKLLGTMDGQTGNLTQLSNVGAKVIEMQTSICRNVLFCCFPFFICQVSSKENNGRKAE